MQVQMQIFLSTVQQVIPTKSVVVLENIVLLCYLRQKQVIAKIVHLVSSVQIQLVMQNSKLVQLEKYVLQDHLQILVQLHVFQDSIVQHLMQQ